MGLFDALFGGTNKSASTENDSKTYAELIRFIKFIKKVKPLAGGVYTMYIQYEAPEPNKGVYSSRVYATVGFYDFDDIEFARRECVTPSKMSKMMIPFYYKSISNKAGLTQADWPYGIDEFDFADVLRGTFVSSYFTFIPDSSNDSIFELKVVGGSDSRNASQVYNSIYNLLKSNFPELSINKNHAYSHSMCITVGF